MTGRSASIRVAGLAALWLLAGQPAAATEDGVYESLSQVSVGRVFLSRAQRYMLDDGRASKPAATRVPTRPAVEAQPEKTQRQSAGYILSSTGQSRVWSARGFVATRPAPGMRFPGDVVVTRTEPRDAEDKPAIDGADTGSSDEGS